MSESEFHGDGSSLSVDETNKLRIKLGLEPLVEEKKLDFVHQPAHNIGDKKQQKKILAKINHHREERELISKLKEVKPLTEDSNVTLDFDLLAKKAKMRREIVNVSDDEEMEEDEAPAYTGDDLVGLTVDHNISRFGSYMPTILTLKDSNVLDEESGDVLQNVNIADYERYEENIKNKKTGVHYNPQSDEDDDYIGEKPQNMLAKYDDEQKKRFVIGSAGNYDLSAERAEAYRRTMSLGTKISIPEKEPTLASDYFTPEEMKAKLKRKVKRKAGATRVEKKVAVAKIETDIEDIKPKKEEGEIEEENNTKGKRSKNVNESSVKKDRVQHIIPVVESDDDEEDFRPTLVYSEMKVINPILRNQIAALKRAKPKVKPIEELLSHPTSDDEGVKTWSDIAFSTSSDSTEKILRKLQEQHESNEARVSTVKEESITIPSPIAPVDQIREISETEDPGQSSGWQPEDKIVHAPKTEKRKQMYKPSDSAPMEKKKKIKLTDGVLGDEVQLNQGVYSALILAQKKGYLEQEREETRLSNPRSDTLRAKNFYEEKIRYDDVDSKAPRRERHSGPLTKFQDKDDYNPEIKLEYNDEHGRTQEPKEAFRTLSHRFHGKSSGKIKCEKRDSQYKKTVTHSALVGDVAMKSVTKQYSKQKEEQKFCVPLSGKNSIALSSFKKTEKKADKKTEKKADKASPK